VEDQLERLHEDERQILVEELKLQERRSEVYARRHRLKKQLAFLERRRKGMFERELESIEELEKLEKEDRDRRRAAGEDVPTPDRSPSPPVVEGSSNSGGPQPNSVAGIAFPSGAELWMDPSFWGDPVSAGGQGSGDGTL
jgi:hypothetical protein